MVRDFQADRLQGADGGFTAGAGTFDADFDFAHAVRHRLAGGILGDLLRGVSGALARAFETDAAGARPAEHVALHVGDGDLGVVESGQNVRDADGDVLRALGLDDFLAGQIIGQQFGSGRSGSRQRARQQRQPSAASAPAAARQQPSAAAAAFLALRLRRPSAAGFSSGFAAAPSALASFFGARFLFVSSAMKFKLN